MKPQLFSSKQFYIALSFIPLFIGIAGFITLLNSPYLGIKFQSKDGKWFVSSLSPDSPAAGRKNQFTNKEVFAIGDFEVKGFDLVEDFDYIPGWASLKHWWDAQRYFSDHIKPGIPIAITVKSKTSTQSKILVTPSSFTLLKALSRTGLMFFVGFFSLIIGLAVILKKPDDLRARIFFLLAFDVSVIQSTFGSYTARDIAFDFNIFTAFRIINGIAFTYLQIINFLSNIKIEIIRISEPVATVIAVWFIIFAYVPVRDKVKKVVKKLLKRETYDLNEVTTRLNRGFLLAGNIQSVLEILVKAIDETLAPKCTSVHMFDKDANSIPPVNRDGRMTDLSTILAEKTGRLQSPSNLYAILSAEEIPKDYTGGTLAPLIGLSRPHGYLLLKDKHSGMLYSSEDLKLLNTLAGQAAMAIENIKLREESLKKEQESAEEKERISMEIHDGVAAELTGIIAYSEKGEISLSEGVDVANIRECFAKIGDFSRRGLQELRNIVWAVKPDITTEDFMAYIKRYCSDHLDIGNIKLEFIQKDISRDIILSPDIRLTIMRIIQEACHNISKHAEAKEVKISFYHTGNGIKLKIKDNGKGFDPDTVSSGNGLKNMRKRVGRIRGGIEILSSPGEGTKIGTDFPLVGDANKKM